MAIICKELKLLYIQVPGTGCSVVSTVLCKQFDGETLGRKHNDVPELVHKRLITEAELGEYLVVANVRNPFDRLVTYYQRLQGGWVNEYLDWSRRNLERRRDQESIPEKEYRQQLVKLAKVETRLRWRSRIIQWVGFNPWLQMTLLRWQFKKSSPGSSGLSHQFSNHLFPMLDRVDIALRQEQLEDAINAVLCQVGVTEMVMLPRKNLTSGKKPYTDYYNAISRKLIERWYRSELAFFGYQFGEQDRVDAYIALSDRVDYSTSLNASS